MTRVLILTESYLPVLGGGERHIHSIATRLSASGTPTCVLTRRTDGDWPVEETLDGVRVIRVAPHGRGRWGKYLMLPSVARLLRKRRDEYDLIVVRGTRVLGMPAVVVARRLQKPIVLQPEISGELSGAVFTWGKSWRRTIVGRRVEATARLRNRILKRADAFIAISSEIEAEFIRAGFPARRLSLFRHGIDTQRFHPAYQDEKAGLRQRLRLPMDATLLVFVGRLLKGKGLEVLLDAFERLLHERSQISLVLVGAGDGQSLSVEDDLRRRVAQSSMAPRVVFAGRVDNVEDYLRASDIFMFPSIFEAFPLAVIEAASCGLACIAARTGGIPDVIDEERNGMLVSPGSVSELVDAARKLVDEPGSRSRMGAAARESVKRRFDLDANVEQYRKLFERLAQSR